MNTKRIFAPFAKIEEQDDGTLIVSGIASSETKDHDGEIVKADAVRAALPDYMRFGAVREMHQPIAAGTALNADVDDNGVTTLEALIVDPSSIKKVQTGVLKGFSLGGRVTKRNGTNKKTIEGIRLTEISLVDRPANPDAVITLTKFDEAGRIVGGEFMEKADDKKADKPKGSYGKVKYADPGLQDDKKPRYPIDNEEHIRAAWNYISKPKNADKYSAANLKRVKNAIVAAWKSKIDKDGPPAAKADEKEKAEKAEKSEALTKSLYDVTRLADTITSLYWLWSCAEDEAIREGDESEVPAALREHVAGLCQVLRDMVDEETRELLGLDEEEDGEDLLEAANAAVEKAIAAGAIQRLAKRGAKFSTMTKAALGDIHKGMLDCCDKMEQLGYKDDADNPEDQDMDATEKAAFEKSITDLKTQVDTLAKALKPAEPPAPAKSDVDTLREELAAAKAELQKATATAQGLADELTKRGYVRAVPKTADVDSAREQDDEEEEPIAKGKKPARPSFKSEMKKTWSAPESPIRGVRRTA